MTTVDTVTVTFYTTDRRDVYTFAEEMNRMIDRPWFGRVMIAPDNLRHGVPLSNQPTAVRAMLEDDA